MQPDFEKANEIYFRLGIIYKQQQKFRESLEVSLLAMLDDHLLTTAVLQVYSSRPTETAQRRGYLVSDRSCPRATKRCMAICISLTFRANVSGSMKAPRLHTDGCLSEIRNTQRSYSSSDGCTTSKATAMPVKIRQLST